MVYCTCCKQDVSAKVHRSHLQGGGKQRTKIHREAVNLTSRIFDKFRKRKRREEDGNGDDNNPAPGQKSARCDVANSASHPDRDTGQQLFDAPDMDVDVLPIHGDGNSRPALTTLPTTRPRIVLADRDAEFEAEHLEGRPLLVHDDAIEDLDPELDEQLLTQHDLTAAELLEGELVSEEMQRRECQSTAV
ncbi:hypothetical protein K438DRAFT_1770938 [Mycena galopus ATCC 62051]|nr:hypothetical protein K438DRAFT_1770918 [Mycena galopus ATCC 62051]KAF8175638.1 hypothetical protein K438DRAFT_1770938 [Mycena galopus ATCC 62051]